MDFKIKELINDLDSQITALQTKTQIEVKKHDVNIIELQTLQELKKHFIQEQKEANLLKIFGKYLDNLKAFFELKINKTSIIDFEQINNTALQEARQINFNENIYFKLLSTYQNNIRQDLNAFFFSPLFSLICELYKDSSIKEAYNVFYKFKQENYTDEEAIILLKKSIEEKHKKEFEADFLEKCSCYQNNIINNLLQIIGKKKNTNEKFSKTKTSEAKPHRGRKKKEIEEKIIVREEGNRIIYETSISKTEKFILSINKNKTITPAMLRDFIYILSVATPHIKTQSEFGITEEMQEVKINLEKASKDKRSRKDWTKKDLQKTLDTFITIKAKSNYHDNEKARKTKADRYIPFDSSLIDDFTIKENEIIITFNKLFTISLMKSQEMIIPMELFRIDLNKYPIAFIIGYFLLLHERRNQKNTSKKEKNLHIETLLNNSGRDINEAVKNHNTKREKELFINNLQILKTKGIIKDYKYKLNNKEYESNEIEDNKTFSEWRKYTLCYNFSDTITQKLKEYNKKPQIRKAK